MFVKKASGQPDRCAHHVEPIPLPLLLRYQVHPSQQSSQFLNRYKTSTCRWCCGSACGLSAADFVMYTFDMKAVLDWPHVAQHWPFGGLPGLSLIVLSCEPESQLPRQMLKAMFCGIIFAHGQFQALQTTTLEDILYHQKVST